jgi:mono/diheme cytochrome c family protein
MLVERADASVVPALQNLARQTSDARAQLHALWILDGVDAIDEATVRQALSAPSRDIRRSAVRIAERWMADASHPITRLVRERAGDEDVSVRRQVAASLGALPESARPAAVAAFLATQGDDPVSVDAALSGLRGQEDATLAVMLAASERSPAREAAITMLTATVVRSADDTAIHHVFTHIGNDARAEWQRTALLSGVEVAWLNAPPPGTPAPRAAAPAQPQPCPTCPGARSGPGGASAFMPAAAGGRQGGPAPIRVNREPEGLAAVVKVGGALGERAARVLARIEWPGKPGASTVAPLTADEQRRFDAGREVYTNACAACHQSDGRGRDRVAPTLVGSTLVLAQAGIPARVVISGKEGPTGLMPPLGQGLTDDQLAAVLTYIRRQWGNTGSPVDAGTVRGVRAESAGRARPWTQDEIMALVAGAR